MAQFDYYKNPNRESSKWAPFIIDLQHEMLSVLATRVMAPLVAVKPAGIPTIQHLNPVVSINGQRYFLSTAEMASVPVAELTKAAGNLSTCRQELMAAIDLLFTAV